MKKYLLTSMSGLFFFAALAQAQRTEGIYPTGICTRDLNAWGNASICECPEKYKYENRAGLCIPADSTLEQCLLTGSLNLNAMAIGGETTGIELVSEEKTYELILQRQLTSKLAESASHSFEVAGELIYLPGVERAERPAIIVTDIKKIN